MIAERGRLAARLLPVACAFGMLLITVGCAARLAELPAPATKHPDFVYPAIPAEFQQTPAAARVERGWRFLQNDNLPVAALEFRAALVRIPDFAPAHAGQGYVALARRDYDSAVKSFDAALKSGGAYVPALVGRGQSLLALKRDDDALDSFERALTADPSLADLRRRVEVLRFRNVQDTIEAARAAVAAGRLDDARTAYQRALQASPESAFLHRELGSVERRRGEMTAALEHYQRALELDPSDVASLTVVGELLEVRRDFAGAEAAYRKAMAIEPSAALTSKLADVAERAREAALPPEFHAILQSMQITRADLAALIGVRLGSILRSAPAAQVVITDTRRHWAASWITEVARAGVIPPFENHTFQPGATLQRADLAAAVSRLIALMSASQPALREHLTARPEISDMNQRHLSYPAAAAAVAADVLPLLEGGRFQAGRLVSGLEAVEAIEQLKTLAAGAP